MPRTGLLVAAALAVAAACVPGGDEAAETPLTTAARGSETTDASGLPSATSTTTLPAGAVVLRVSRVRLVQFEQPDDALRLIVDSADRDLAVVMTGIPAGNAAIVVCPALDLDRRGAAPGCVTPAPGETFHVPHAPAYRGIEILQLAPVGAGPDATSATVGEVAVTYGAVSREVGMRLPRLDPGEARVAAGMTMRPPGDGTYRASVTWPGEGTAEAQLIADTSVFSQAEGGPGLLLTGSVSPPVPAVLSVRNTGSAPLRGLTVEAAFP